MMAFPPNQLMEYHCAPSLKTEAGRLIGALRSGSVVPELEDRVAMKLALEVLKHITNGQLVYSVLMCHSFMGRMKLMMMKEQVWTHDRAFQTNNLTTGSLQNIKSCQAAKPSREALLACHPQ